MVNINSVVSDYYLPLGGERFEGVFGKPIVFVSIPKNAHTWAIETLTNNSIINTDIKIPKRLFSDPEYLVILREPIDRWISGAVEFFFRTGTKYMSVLQEEKFCDVLFNIMRLDEHTKPQLDFIAELPLDKTVFFKFGDTLSQDFISYFNEANPSSPLEVSVDHYGSASLPNKKPIHDQLLHVLRDPKYKNKLLEFTKHDRALFDYITQNNLWYGAR